MCEAGGGNVAQHTAGEFCHALWRSGTHVPASQSLPSSSSLHSMKLCTNSGEPIGVPKILTPFKPHTPSPKSSTRGRGTCLHDSILAFCPCGVGSQACQQLLFKEIVPVTCPDRAVKPTYTSSKYAKRVLANRFQFVADFAQRAVNPQTEQQWHERVSLFTAFSLLEPVSDPCAVFPHVRRGSGADGPHEGQQSWETGDTVQLGEETAPQDVIVRPHAVNGEDCTLGVCICHRSDGVTHAVSSARVERANWKGAQTASTAFPNCRANVFATSLRKDVPDAIPRTPPSCFKSAVIVAAMNALVMGSGASAPAKSSATRNRRWRVSASSKHTFNIS